MRWTNYLRPDIKRGRFSFEEEETIIQLHSILGNKWSAIAARLPGRTDNAIKNYWNTHIRKRLLKMGIDPVTHSPRLDLVEQLSSAMCSSSLQLNNLSDLLGLQAILNPDLLNLLGNLILPQNQQDSQTHLPNLINQNQSQLPTSTADQFPASISFSTLTRVDPKSNQYVSCQLSPEDSSLSFGANVLGQTGFENCLNNHQSFGFDTLGSKTMISSSRNVNASMKGSSSSEDDSSSIKFEIPTGCLDINDFL